MKIMIISHLFFRSSTIFTFILLLIANAIKVESISSRPFVRKHLRSIQNLKSLPSSNIYSNTPNTNKIGENIAILSVYFIQGSLGISSLARTFFLKDELHLSPSQSAAILGASSLPWAIKPLYGFLSDTIPLFGYKRR